MQILTWKTALALVLIVCGGMAHANIIIDETFDTDPGWTQANMVSANCEFGYNSTQHNIALPGTSTNPGVYRNSATTASARYYAALPGSVTQDTDFTFSFDYNLNTSSWGATAIGLFKSGANNLEGTASGVVLRVGRDVVNSCRLRIYTSAGVFTNSGQEQVMMSGHMEVDYVAATQTVTWSFTKADSTQVTRTVVLTAGATFESDQFGVGNSDTGYDYNWFKGNFDNMYLNANAVPEPMTLGLLTFGGIMGLVKRRK